VLHWSAVTAPSWTGAGQMAVLLSRVPPSSFEGCDMEAVREWAAQCHGFDTGLPAQLPHSAGDGCTTRVGGTAPGYDSQAVSEGRRGRDSPLTRAPAACQSIQCSGRGSWCGVMGLRRPRARRRLAQGCIRPSSEVEVRPRGRQALERGGGSPEGASGPRARWRLTRGGVRPSSEAEDPWHGAWSSSDTQNRPRGTAAGCLVGRCGFLGRGPFFASGCGHVECVLRFAGLFVCLLLFFKRGVFPGY
jgi:hypothetical protein